MKNQLAAISFVFFLQFFGYNLAEAFLSYYASAFLSVFEITMLIFGVYFSFAIADLFAGKLVEQYGTVRCIRLGALMYAPLLFLLWSTTSFWPLFAGALFVGCGAALLWIGAKTFVLRSSTKRGGDYGLFNGVSIFGGAVAGLAGGWLATSFAISNIFLLGGVSILCAFLTSFLLVDRNDTRTRYPLAEQWRMFRDARLLRLGAIGFLGSLFFGVSAPLTALIVKSLGGTAMDVGVLLFVSLVLGAVAMAFGGRLSDRFGRKPIMYAALLAGAFAAFMLSLAPSYWVILAAVALYVLSWRACNTALVAAVGDLFRERLALAVVVLDFAMTLGTAVGALLAGALSFEGLRMPFLALGILLLFSPLVVRGVKTK